MKTLYFIKLTCNDSVQVMFRPTHSIVDILQGNNVGFRRLKEILSFSNSELITYLRTSKYSPKDRILNKLSSRELVDLSEDEIIYKKSWKSVTDNIIRSNKLPKSNDVDLQTLIKLWKTQIKAENTLPVSSIAFSTVQESKEGKKPNIIPKSTLKRSNKKRRKSAGRKGEKYNSNIKGKRKRLIRKKGV